MDLGLADRVYVVTGGTSGLGRATARALVAEGARVFVVSRDADRLADTSAELGERCGGTNADLTDDGAPNAILLAAREAFGRLDGVFVSHGGPPAGAAADATDDMLRTGFDAAALAPIRMARDAANTLAADPAADAASVVVLTSTSSAAPIAGLATSNAARPATWGFLKTLADEMGPRGVRVNALLPGRFATPRLAELFAAQAEERGSTPDAVRDEAAAGIPARRIGDPDELGRVAAFLLSPAASYVTGAAWSVDGGVTRGL